MKKVLITGGAGYIGGYLTDYLLSKGYETTVYDNLFYETRYLKDVHFIRGDIRDTRKLATLIDDYDVIIWLAALVGDGACDVDHLLTRTVNLDPLLWLIQHYHGKIVFASTCSVYGVNDELIDETAVPNPLSIYAKTKLEAEKHFLESNQDYFIIRLGTLFGLSDAHSRIRFDLVVNLLTMKAVNHEKLTVFGGEQWRPLLHVKDVAHAIEFGIANDIKGLYNLSYQNFRIWEIAERIQNIIPSARVEHIEVPFQDLRNYKVSTTRFDAYGWKPTYTLEDGIEEVRKLLVERRITDLDSHFYSNAMFVKANLEKFSAYE